jgi:hypothetical protein
MISAFIGAYTETIRRIERGEERARAEEDFKGFAAKKSRSRKQKHKGKKKR